MRFILLTHSTTYTRYPQKYLQPFHIFMQWYFGRHHSIINFVTMVVHSAEWGESPLFKIKHSFCKQPLSILIPTPLKKNINWATAWVRDKWVFKTDRLQMTNDTLWNQIKNILRTYSASLELPRNIYLRTDFTYPMRAIPCTSLNYTEEKAKRNRTASSIRQRWKLLSHVITES